jgi:DNA-cytosine methyltransferase
MLEYPKTKIMKILSLFDGVSCARLALEKAGIPVEAYYASEIDKYAIKVTQANRPDTIQMGSVLDVKYDREWKHIECLKGFSKKVKIELLIGGSPCQDLSIAKKDRKGLDGERSGLFWEYVRILKEVKPKYFILENVNSMPKEAKDTVSEALGVQPVMINASLVSAQNRKRLFWVGSLQNDGTYKQIEIPQPEDRRIILKDVLESDVDKKYNVSEKHTNAMTGLYSVKAITMAGTFGNRKIAKSDKAYCLAANPSSDQQPRIELNETVIRKLTPIECERLQCMPDGWTNPTGDISNTQRYKMCGNAFNVDVVAHIIKHLK